VFHHLEKPRAVLDEIIRLLRHGGKAVLSDFSDKGLEIINACHTSEGRTHDYFKHRLNEAKEYFITKGFNVKECQSEVQKVLIAERTQGKKI
jgi:2-polyprenyl-3-methyl-5-hydroxy-6-metoxy-1,4-benzoquinol methylase